jgi:hypothetical protein
MNEKQIALFESLNSQLKGLYDEMQTLAKKNPNDAVNKFKLGLINSLIKRTNAFLKEDQKPFGDFGEFDEAELPSNSDVLIILSQYLSCLEKIRADNITIDLGDWYWLINGKQSNGRTAPPKNLGKS